MTTSPKFLISGYYGHNNFGDEAILSVIVEQLRNEFDNPQITVLSSNPQATSIAYKVNSAYKFDFFAVLKVISQCDVFVSGGGSLFQDVTSIKSLVYYLLLLLTAKLFGKKTFVFAQGVGPLNSGLARNLTGFVLKTTDSITVRDDDSATLLSSLGVSSAVTADPVWMLPFKGDEAANDILQVGVQLRNWKSLGKPQLEMLADAIIKHFGESQAHIILLSLQNKEDEDVLMQFHNLLLKKGCKNNISLQKQERLQTTISCLANLDYLIAMRYHAGLVAARHCVPSLLLSYDPKVTSLAQEANLPCVPVDEMTFERLDAGIEELIAQKDSIKSELQTISDRNGEKARETLLNLKRAL